MSVVATSKKICGKYLKPITTGRLAARYKAGDTVKLIKRYSGQSTINIGDQGTVYCGSSGGMIGVVWHKASTRGHSGTGSCTTGTTSGHCNHGDQMWYVTCSNIAKA